MNTSPWLIRLCRGCVHGRVWARDKKGRSRERSKIQPPRRTTTMSISIERSIAIMKAHVEALGGCDHREVSAGDLFPAIAKLVPAVTHNEIVAVFQHTADRAIENARRMLPKFPSGRANDILNLVIHARDRTAVAITYAQGCEAGDEGMTLSTQQPAAHHRNPWASVHSDISTQAPGICADGAEVPLRTGRGCQTIRATCARHR
jgi:hypothetical protein